jgi:Lrp/AsnC family transcriptional regulator
MHSALDAIDVRLLQALQEDASLSASELAAKVGISQSPCWRRIERLKSDGFIKREVAILDRQRLGLNAQIFARVKMSAHGHARFAEFARAIQSFPEVLECYVLLGDVDYLLRIVTEDIEAYERFVFGKLLRLPGVQEVNSTVALSEIKSSMALPLQHVERPKPAGGRKRVKSAGRR